MQTSRVVALVGSLVAVQACTRTVYVPVSSAPQTAPAPAARPVPQPEPLRERPQPAPAPAPAPVMILGIPASYLPDMGQCRIWSPGVAPGRQRFRHSQSCHNIGNQAPVGSWVVYRPSQDPELAHVRVTDRHRPGKIHVVHVFEVESGRFLGDEAYDDAVVTQADPQPQPRGTPRAIPPAAVPTAAPTAAPEPRRQPQQAPNPTMDPGSDQRPIPVPPPVAPRTDATPTPTTTTTLDHGGERRKPTSAPAGAPTAPVTSGPLGGPAPAIVPTAAPAPAPAPEPKTDPAPKADPAFGAPAPAVAPLDIPPGHMPDVGKCRIWIPGTVPGRQPHRDSGDCNIVTRAAPPASWVVYRPAKDRKLVHVRVIDAKRQGVVVAVRVYDDNGKFVREEQP